MPLCKFDLDVKCLLVLDCCDHCLMIVLFVVALQFTADMKLMFENCLDYNGSDSSK